MFEIRNRPAPTSSTRSRVDACASQRLPQTLLREERNPSDDAAASTFSELGHCRLVTY